MARLAACVLVLSTPALLTLPAAGDDRIDFNRDVRPILSDACFQCHGPDDNTREADLRLDERDSLFADRDGHAVIVPGKPQQSEIIARLTATDADLRMPPADFSKSLKPEQIEVVRKWIEQGAEWKGHWAYVPPIATLPPLIKDVHDFAENDIDRFVYAMLLQKDLAPSPRADKVTLIRRLSFDLRGLPPTVEEVDAFLADDSDDAYEKVVDRFLADPKFGERMAINWLDFVRYADTGGYHSDNERNVWLYRDWVIDAFNENKPYDEFTIEQIAGDLLENPTRSQRIASGYNRLLQTTQEGGAQAKEYTAKYAADRVRNVSSVWLGSTMGCSECHDHKFDPFTMADFYAMEAFFADVQETPVGHQREVALPTEEQQAEIARLNAEMARLKKTLDTPTPELAAEFVEWEKDFRESGATSWIGHIPSEMKANGAELKLGKHADVVATGPSPEKETYTLVFDGLQSEVTGLRLQVFANDALPAKGPGRAANGNFVLSEIELRKVGAKGTVKLSTAVASHSQQGYDVKQAIDGKTNTGWAILPKVGESSEAVFILDKALPVSGPEKLEVTMKFEYGSSHSIGHFLISFAHEQPTTEILLSNASQAARTALAVAPDERSDLERNEVAKWFRTIAPSLDPVRAELTEVEKRKTAVEKAAPMSLVSMSTKPRTIRILPRGNWLDDSGPVVEPAVPTFLGGLEVDGRATRLDLAKWIVTPDNPLTARVAVNRLWKQCFGNGLATTLEDFGSQGAWPTHPELLDWLAVDFVQNGWDVKRTLKLIVMSGTYRQSSKADDELRRIDPYNKWLARQSRYRIPAEMVRDNALAVSGLLNPKIGGPSVKPYQPEGYWKHLNFPKRTWKHDGNENQYRRGLYTFWQRSFLHPSLLAFDAPSREECVVERPRSNNPLQALVLLNDPTYVEASRALAERVLDEGGESAESRVRFAFRTVLQRQPSDEEVAVLVGLAEKHLADYRADDAAAKEFLSIGMKPLPASANAAEVAAWTSVARTLLNLHETITRS